MGFVQLMDGEKDPRNLRLAFSIVRRILEGFPYQEDARDLFDITSCYFPVSFTAPVNDPTAVQPHELRLALRFAFSVSLWYPP